jgi:hypothetical protein
MAELFPPWVLMSTAGCWTDFHRDGGGCATQIAIIHGAKLWFFKDEMKNEYCVEVLRQGDVLWVFRVFPSLSHWTDIPLSLSLAPSQPLQNHAPEHIPCRLQSLSRNLSRSSFLPLWDHEFVQKGSKNGTRIHRIHQRVCS